MQREQQTESFETRAHRATPASSLGRCNGDHRKFLMRNCACFIERRQAGERRVQRGRRGDREAPGSMKSK